MLDCPVLLFVWQANHIVKCDKLLQYNVIVRVYVDVRYSNSKYEYSDKSRKYRED